MRVALDHESSAGKNFASAIRARFKPLGGVELELPPREPMREPPQLDRVQGSIILDTNDPLAVVTRRQRLS